MEQYQVDAVARKISSQSTVVVIHGEAMGLNHEDFRLSDDQLAEINNYTSRTVAAYARSGEGPAMGGLKVEFVWTPALGRSITAYFDGATEGYSIESWFD